MIENIEKSEKQCLTNETGSGILSKLSARAAVEAGPPKKVNNFEKNKLTRWKPCANIMTVPLRDVYLVN